ncbi:hypothetical protein H4R99_003485 [Coemansia sp. RSA 1722]|nr:hypothetical protein H4R99_003485 [Coemansia sp. RSA 1722]
MAMASTAKPWTCGAVAIKNDPTDKQRATPSSARPLVQRPTSKVVTSTAKLRTNTSVANKSGSAVQPRTTLSLPTKPLVEPTVSRANPLPAKLRDRIAVTDKSEPPVLRKAKSALPVRPATKPAVPRATTLTSKRLTHVVAINKNVSVRRLDEREVVEAVIKPINLLAGQRSASTLHTAPQCLIPEARYVSSAETLMDNSDAISTMSTDDWDMVSHEDAAAFKPLRGPKRVWNKTKEKAAGLRRTASTISIRRHRSMNAELAK